MSRNNGLLGQARKLSGAEPRKRRDDKLQTAMAVLRDYAFIHEPEDCEEPILAPGARAALHHWLIEIRNSDKLADVGLKPRNTALLYGPPGTGKTTFAHHFAARLGLPLVAVKSESIIDMYLGATGKNIGRLFDALDDCIDENGVAQVVVLMDEIDSLGSKRTEGSGADQERAASLNVLLRRVERFHGVLFGATNRKAAIDSALWRRFSLQINIDLPSENERFAIIKRYAYPFDLADSEVETLTELTAGASPSLLRQLMEGMKRTIVLSDGKSRAAADPVFAFRTVKDAIEPPPEMDRPALWINDSKAAINISNLSTMKWPPNRYPKEEAA
ncbi:ATP-binding protein [Hyphomicrobium sp.]|uniref:ATP-binding protein n=1 Tax=Hyphomicrobium sp. TaxID=82 RepID=UPI001D5CB24F|nr:ATP-binding protein [Hyphomicrobium sp.]MBY0561422.1 ATP-binding protein [Hyphomicrobium sp.]